jgi:hypothetical protein
MRASIALILVLIPVSALAAEAGGKPCLTRSDASGFQQIAREVQDAYASITKLDAGSELGLRRAASLLEDVIADIRNTRETTANADVRRFYTRVISMISGQKDLAVVGASLVKAHRERDLNLLKGLVESVLDEDAKRLAGPVFSALELERRIEEFGAMVEADDRDNRRNYDIWLNELMEGLKGTDFCPAR